MKRQYRHKKGKASDASRESNGVLTEAGGARKTRSARATDTKGGEAPPATGLTSGEVETLSGLVTSAMSSLCAVRAILDRRALNERRSE